MGFWKQKQMEDQDKMNTAAEIAVRAGYLKRCDLCEEIFFDYGDPEPAYKLANYLITKNDPLVEIFKGNRGELSDCIKALEHEIPEKCHCAELMSRDD